MQRAGGRRRPGAPGACPLPAAPGGLPAAPGWAHALTAVAPAAADAPRPPPAARRPPPAAQDFRQRLELAQAPEERAELLGKVLVSPEELRAQLLVMRDRKALTVLLVDLLDASGGPPARVAVGRCWSCMARWPSERLCAPFPAPWPPVRAAAALLLAGLI
jgi:hypothetical protein